MEYSLTPEVREKLLKKFQEERPQWTQLCRGFLTDLDGKRDIRVNPSHGACHSWLTDWFRSKGQGASTFNMAGDWKEGSKNFLVGNLSPHHLTCKKTSFTKFMTWMCSDDMPLSQYILNRDNVDECVEHGVVLFCGPDGLNAVNAMWICKVIRHGIECGKSLDVWEYLVEGGVKPMLALLVASYIRGEQRDAFTFTGLMGHCSVFGGWSEESAKVLVQDKIHVESNANSTNRVFAATVLGGYKEETSLATKFTKFCKPRPVSDGWGGTVEGQGADKKVFLEQVLAWQDQISGGKTVVKEVNKMPTNETVYLEVDL